MDREFAPLVSKVAFLRRQRLCKCNPLGFKTVVFTAAFNVKSSPFYILCVLRAFCETTQVLKSLIIQAKFYTHWAIWMNFS